jgi:hypothetical protein
MGKEGLEEEEICRSLAEGWHFRPDWRSRLVDRLLEQGVGQSTGEILRDEEDCYVRQLYLLRRNGRCLETAAFKWAYNCHANNGTTGAGSLVRALTVAKVPSVEIAGKLATKSKNVLVYQRLFFDVVRYLDDQAWVASIVFSPPTDSNDIAELREKTWVTAAFLRGERGLGQMFDRRIAVTPEEQDAMTCEIKSAVTVRAFEYLNSLRTGVVPPGREDFDRLIRMLDVGSKQPLKADSQDRTQIFMRDMMGMWQEIARRPENSGDPVLQTLLVDKTTPGEKPAQQKVLTW